MINLNDGLMKEFFGLSVWLDWQRHRSWLDDDKNRLDRVNEIYEKELKPLGISGG